MRFIIHEMAYEKPLTAGKWKYLLDGQPTGAVEEWRLADALEGYRFLRVDLDARAAASRRSTLYHLTLDENGNPVQLKYRFWIDGLETIGAVLLEKDAVIVTRETTGGRQEEVLAVPAGYAFWFPATAGLSLLAKEAGHENQTAVTLLTAADDPALLMSPLLTAVTVREHEQVPVEVMGKNEMARRMTVSWENQRRLLWIDEEGWPLRMERDDRLTAVIARRIKYQRITAPGVNNMRPAAGT